MATPERMSGLGRAKRKPGAPKPVPAGDSLAEHGPKPMTRSRFHGQKGRPRPGRGDRLRLGGHRTAPGKLAARPEPEKLLDRLRSGGVWRVAPEPVGRVHTEASQERAGC
jgi:hypothetical protein